MLTNDNKEAICENGFVKLERFFSPWELDNAEVVISKFVSKNSVIGNHFKRDLSPYSSVDGPGQIEILRPALSSRLLRESSVYLKCRQFAAEYFEQKVYYLFDHAIYKMPRSQAVVPWHQDQAYLGKDVDIPSLHFWIPFQDVDAENGSISFIEKSHRKYLIHQHAFTGNDHILTVETVPPGKMTSTALAKGDISIHTNLTLHCSGENASDLPRKAWILHFGIRSLWFKKWLELKNKLCRREK